MALDIDERTLAEKIIETNKFSDKDIGELDSEKIRELLNFYKIRR